MRINPRHRILMAGAVLVLCLASAAAADTAEGWAALWSNDVGRAELAFRHVVDEDSKNGEAWRGLLVTHLLMGRDRYIEEDLKEYARRSPGEPFDWYLARAVSAMTGLESRRHYRNLHEFTKKLAERDGLPPVDRRVALDQASVFAFYQGKPDQTRKLVEQLGRIHGWSLLGPFDNTSGSGHARSHIEGFNVSAGSFRGKFGQEIRWNTPPITGIDGILVASRYFYEDTEGTAYLRTVVDMDEAGRYLLSLSHEGDVEFWVDGVHLFSGHRDNGGQEVAHWDLGLDRGPHLLAARLSNRDDESQFGVGLSRPDGKPAKFTVRPRDPFTPTSLDVMEQRPVVPQYRAELARRLEAALADGGDEEAVFWGLWQALHTERPDSVLSLCERVEAAHPDGAALLVICGLVYNALDKDDDVDRVLEHAGSLDRNLALPDLHEGQNQLQTRRYDQTVAASEKVLERSPSCLWAHSLRLQALLGQQDLERVESLARDLVERQPESPLGYDFLSSWAEARGMQDESRRQDQEALKRRAPLTRHYQRLLQKLRQEDYDETKDAIEDLIQYTPDMAWLWSYLVESQVAKGDFEDALETLDMALEAFPQSVSLLYYKALFAEGNAYDPYNPANSKPRAARIIGDALNFAPGSMPLRDKHRTLSGKTAYRDYLPDPELGDILARKVSPEAYPGASAVVLQEWKRRLFFDNDISMRDYSLAVQVLTKAGVEQWQEYRLGVGAAGRVLVEHKTVKADGTEVDATVYGNEIHFENLEPGDVVVLHYQSTEFQGGQLKGHTWDQHRFPFGDPCLESRYEIIAGASLDVNVKLHNHSSEQPVELETEDLDDGYKVRRWVMRHIPGQVNESNATHHRSFLPWVDVSTVGSWRQIATWYSDLAAGQTELDRDVRAKAEELCGGLTDDGDKVEAIYRFVSQDINYVSVPFYMSAHVPRRASEVLDSRFGDCKDKSCLMIALLRAVGIDDARFALIDVWGSRAVEMLPSPRFNHAVVCRPDGQGGYRWYDPTIKYGTSRQTPGALAGGLALVADPATTGLTTIVGEPAEAYPSLVVSTVELRADGSASVHRVSQDRNIDETARQRARLENLSPDELREGVLEALAVSYPGATLDTVLVRGRTDVDSLLVVETAFEAPHMLQDSGSFLIGEVPWAARLSSELNRVVAKADRTSPIDLHRLRACEQERLEIVLPAGIDLVELPESRSLAFGACRYTTSYEQQDRTLVVTSEIVFDGDRVMPDAYPEFKAFLEAVFRDQDTRLLFRSSS